jgi:hypothetical protein
MAKPDDPLLSGAPWWVTAIAVIAVPILVALITTVVTQFYTATEKSRAQDIHMVEIGVSLIAPDPSNDPKRSGARSWALDVMEKYSGVRFSAEARDLIIGNSVQVDKQILPRTSSQPQPPVVPESSVFLERIGGNDYVAILDDPGHSPKWTGTDGTAIEFSQPLRDIVIKAAGGNITVFGGQIFSAYAGTASTGGDLAEWLKGVGKKVAEGTCFHLIAPYRDQYGGLLFGKIEDAPCP